MKKKYVMAILGTLMMSLTACSAGEAESNTQIKNKENLSASNSGYQSIAIDGLGATAPEGVKIVENPEEFQPVSDTSYHFETDYQNNFSGLNMFVDCIETEDSYIFFRSSFLYVFGKETKSYRINCDDPTCTHEFDPFAVEEGTFNCSAYVGEVMAIEYYKGNIYAVVMGVDRSQGVRKDTLELQKMSLNGKNRETICQIAKGIAFDSEADDNCFTLWCAAVHRGYLYYAYSYGSGQAEDTFYLNNSNILYRVALNGKEEPECICPMIYGGVISNMRLTCQGAYVYFVRTENVDGKMGYLYRYNTESNEMEYMDIGPMEYYQSDGNKIIYKTDIDGQYYIFDTQSGTVDDFIELPPTENMRYGYMTLTDKYYNILVFNRDKYIRKVFSREGTLLAEYDCSMKEIDGDYFEFLDGNSDFDFMLSQDGSKLLYMDKTEMLNGNAEFVPAH